MTIELPKEFSWFKWLALALVAAMILSCGAKSKVVQKEVSTQEKDIVVHEKEKFTNKVDFNSLLKNIKIEPIDANKPHSLLITTPKDTFTLSGNNVRYVQKTETIDSSSSTIQEKEKDFTDKSQIAIRDIKKEKESEGWNWKGLNWFVFFLIIAFVVFVYYKFRQ